MGKFIERTIEEYTDKLNTTYFMHGDKPLSDALIDDIEGYVYKAFGWNHLNERMYLRFKI